MALTPSRLASSRILKPSWPSSAKSRAATSHNRLRNSAISPDVKMRGMAPPDLQERGRKTAIPGAPQTHDVGELRLIPGRRKLFGDQKARSMLTIRKSRAARLWG